MKGKVGEQWNKIFMEIFRSMSWFFASFSGVLDWIVLILVWFERSLHSAQVSRQSCPWTLKLMTSQRVERTRIRTGGYRRFRGEWVTYSLHCLSVLCSCTFRSATFLHRTQISHCLPWVPEVFPRVRRGASFFSAAGRRHERRSAGHFLMIKTQSSCIEKIVSCISVPRLWSLITKK